MVPRLSFCAPVTLVRLGCVLLGAALFGGCKSGPDPSEVCSVDESMDAGVTAGIFSGEEWTSGVSTTWQVAGDSVQLNAPRTDAWMLTLVAQLDHDGNSVASLVDSGAFPIHVSLNADDGEGFAALYPETGDSYATTNAGTGELELLRLDQTVLVGCFAFTAATDAGEEVTVEDASIKARSAQ